MPSFCLAIYVFLICFKWKEINFWSKSMKNQIFKDRAIENILHWNVIWPLFFPIKRYYWHAKKMKKTTPKYSQVWTTLIPNMTSVSWQWVWNFNDWRISYSFPVEAQNSIQIIWICWKGTCFCKLSYARHKRTADHWFFRPWLENHRKLVQRSAYFLLLTWLY